MKGNNLHRGQNAASITGAVAAIAASSCCILPIVAALAGVSSLSLGLEWIGPFRPYLIGFSIVAIAFAWYIHLKPAKKDNCGCEVSAKKRFYERRPFLVVITLFAAISMGFPYYSYSIMPTNSGEYSTEIGQTQSVELKVIGMTCTACESHVNHASLQVKGVKSASSDYENESALVVFDPKDTDIEQIAHEIERETGYSVKELRN